MKKILAFGFGVFMAVNFLAACGESHPTASSYLVGSWELCFNPYDVILFDLEFHDDDTGYLTGNSFNWIAQNRQIFVTSTSIAGLAIDGITFMMFGTEVVWDYRLDGAVVILTIDGREVRLIRVV